MLANGIKETTATTGTGTVSLAASAGFARYSAVYAVNDRVSYCIKDGDNREWGVGTVGATNTLARTFVLGTLIVGTYSSSLAGALTPITLASGAADVFCDLHDLILPELGLDYLQVPPDPTRMTMPFLGGCHAAYVFFTGNGSLSASTMGTVGTIAGSATGRAIAATNKFVSSLRLGHVSLATAEESTGRYFTVRQATRGSAAGQGGFLFTARFGVSDAALVAGARMFVGLMDTAVELVSMNQSSVDSSSTNTIGLLLDTADANFSMFSRGAAATKTDLGAGFSRATVSTNVHLMTLSLWAPPNGTFVGYRLTMEGTSPAETTGVLTTNLPVNTATLTPHVWRNNAATAAVVGLDILNISLVTPV